MDAVKNVWISGQLSAVSSQLSGRLICNDLKSIKEFKFFGSRRVLLDFRSVKSR